MLQKFIKEGKNVYLINTNDYSTFNGGRNYYLLQKGIDITQFKTEFFTKESIKNTAKVAKIAAKYPQVKWINLSDFFQKKKKDKEILTFFTDDNHLSIYGVNYLIEVFKNRTLIDKKDLEE